MAIRHQDEYPALKAIDAQLAVYALLCERSVTAATARKPVRNAKKTPSAIAR